MKHLIVWFFCIHMLSSCSPPEKENTNQAKIKDTLTPQQETSNVETGNEKDFRYPKLASTGEKLQDFIPQGWTLLDSVSGKLNQDRYPDYVLIVEGKDTVTFLRSFGGEELEVEDKPRIMAVLFGTEKGYMLSDQANKAILSSQEGGMMGEPYQGISITNGSICTGFWGGSREKWNLSHCFTYSNGHWQLQNVETSGGHAELSYEANYNIQTGNFNYRYEETENNEEADSMIILKNEQYEKVIKKDTVISLSSFSPWSLRIDDKITF